MPANFWDFEPSTKLDVLLDRRGHHADRIWEALADRETHIEPAPSRQYGNWVFYNKEEALLIRSECPIIRLTIYLIYCLFQIMNHATPEQTRRSMP